MSSPFTQRFLTVCSPFTYRSLTVCSPFSQPSLTVHLTFAHHSLNVHSRSLPFAHCLQPFAHRLLTVRSTFTQRSLNIDFTHRSLTVHSPFTHHSHIIHVGIQSRMFQGFYIYDYPICRNTKYLGNILSLINILYFYRLHFFVAKSKTKLEKMISKTWFVSFTDPHR